MFQFLIGNLIITNFYQNIVVVYTFQFLIGNLIMNRASASNAKKQANMSAFSSILGSASSIAKLK